MSPDVHRDVARTFPWWTRPLVAMGEGISAVVIGVTRRGRARSLISP